ncbi:MAG: MFS transporter [Cyclobacteriaceae bacterium]|nr:MFS transporter [Cyclobacteriaceae bacterium]
MNRNYFIVGLIMFVFFVISFLTNIMGPLVPAIIEDFDLSLTLVAILPFAFFVAYGVFSIPSGVLVERYGEQKVMVWAFFMSFIGALSLALFPNYLMAILSLFFIGTGMAMLQVAINPLLRTAGGEEHFAFNSVMAQMLFGLASFLSPLAYTYLVTNLDDKAGASNFLLDSLARVVPENLSWVSMYWLFALISLIMVVLIKFSKLPRVELKEDERVGKWSTIVGLIKRPVIILYFLGIFFYVGSEQGVNNWVSEFLQTYHGADPLTVGATVISRFWGLMTLGTLLGLLLLKLIDSRYVLIGFSAAAIVSLTVALFGGLDAAVIAFPLVGFFASVMWSILISLSLNSVAEHHGTIAGVLVTGIVGGAVWPLIIGSIGDVFGLKTGMLLLYISLGYILSVGFWARPLVTNKTVNWNKNNEDK